MLSKGCASFLKFFSGDPHTFSFTLVVLIQFASGSLTPTLQAHELSDSIFNHMFRYESAVEARRRALMLVDVLVASCAESVATCVSMRCNVCCWWSQ